MTMRVWAPDGVPEIYAGADLAALLVAATTTPLADGDLVLITSKVVSKAENRVVTVPRDEAIATQTVRLVARRGGTRIVRNRQGLTMAAAGVDASHVCAGSVLLLPEDPDASARGVRRRLAELTGRNVGVLITDTAGRPWREGQTDIAIGAAGLTVLESFAGRTDSYGNDLVVTAPAVADELAGAAELVQTKLGGRPFAVVRGLARLVLAADEDGPGAVALQRPAHGDMFGFGAREAVIRALAGAPADREVFGSAAGPEEMAAAIESAFGTSAAPAPDGLRLPEGLPDDGVAALLFAHGWERPDADRYEIRPARP